MKNNSKKIIIIILVVILIIISLVAYFLSQKNNPNDQGGISNNPTISYEIESLNDNNTFFSIQNAINDYYQLITSNKNNTLYNILEPIYKTENNISSSNVINVLNKNYEDVTFVAKKIYYNINSDITYYFVNGYLFNRILLGSDYSYEKDVNILLIANKSNYYFIKPLESQINIYDYAKAYNIKNVDITSNIKLSSLTVSEDKKLETYLSEFLNLLYIDSAKAYSMLDESMKNKYPTLSAFNININTIYNTLSSSVFAYSIIKEENPIIYSIKDKKQNTIQIIENNIMDYKISF